MSEVYKTHEDGLFFVSFSVVGWLDVFTRRDYQDLLIDSIIYCQQNKGLELFSYCIMPSHVHWIAARKEGKLSDVLRDFKAHTAKELMNAIAHHPAESRREWLMHQFHYFAGLSAQKQEKQFWKHDNHAFALYSNELIDQKIEYIHRNPVEAGFVNEPEEWRLSSANPDSPIPVMEL